jgi:NAD(P) transhydrogenase
MSRYDLIAIGSGPAGRCAALEAAKLGKRVAIAEREGAPRSGEIPSKTLQATIVKLTSAARRAAVTIDDRTWRTELVLEQEQETVADRLRCAGVELLAGTASFVDPHTLAIRDGEGSYEAAAERFVIAVGTTPARPPRMDFDDRTLLDPGGFGRLPEIPATLTIVGAGIVGLEYASMAAALGCRVTLIDRRSHVLEPVDVQIVEALVYHLRGLGVVVRLGADVIAVERDSGAGAVTHLRGGERLASDAVIHTGRRGATARLGLAAAGLAADDHGRIAAGPDGRTAQPHIFAAGDVTGFPALAAASAEQGRIAALAAFGIPARSLRAPLSYAIHTIPDLSFAGAGERELQAAGEPFVRGVARYRELSRGAIEGDRSGLLKLLVHARTRRVEGVHVFGTAATELIHVGQTVMAGGLPVDYLAGAVCHFPAFADAYRIAALDAIDRLEGIGAVPARTPGGHAIIAGCSVPEP